MSFKCTLQNGPLCPTTSVFYCGKRDMAILNPYKPLVFLHRPWVFPLRVYCYCLTARNLKKSASVFNEFTPLDHSTEIQISKEPKFPEKLRNWNFLVICT